MTHRTKFAAGAALAALALACLAGTAAADDTAASSAQFPTDPALCGPPNLCIDPTTTRCIRPVLVQGDDQDAVNAAIASAMAALAPECEQFSETFVTKLQQIVNAVGGAGRKAVVRQTVALLKHLRQICEPTGGEPIFDPAEPSTGQLQLVLSAQRPS